jgi:RPA family protein
MDNQKRQIAYKVRIKEMVTGNYIKEDGWEPNHILLDNQLKVSRVNIIGAVVDKSADNGYLSMLLDDGSGKISARFFQEFGLAKEVNIGDIVLMIGRIREYGAERYIVPEILKKIEDKKWADVRRLELQRQDAGKRYVSVERKKIEPIAQVVEKSPINMIYSLIRKLDKGDGADIDTVIKDANMPDAEKIIINLLEKGEIFEIRKGKIKVLE